MNDDLEGSGHGVIGVISRYLPGVFEEKHEINERLHESIMLLVTAPLDGEVLNFNCFLTCTATFYTNLLLLGW
jgi:hypothetical protein